MRWSRIVAALLLAPVVLVLLGVGAMYLRFQHFKHFGIYEEHRGAAIRELCGLLAPDARPVAAYMSTELTAGSGHFYWAAFPLDDEVARTVAAGRIEQVASPECRQASDWLRHGKGWVPAAEAVRTWSMRASFPTDVGAIAGLPSPQLPGMRWLVTPPPGEPQAWTSALADGGGFYLESGGGKWSGIPRILVHPGGKRVFLNLWYIHDLSFW
jgi:hypothetical protein